MSTLDIVGYTIGHSVQTSVADLLARNARLNDTLTKVATGCLDLCGFCPDGCEYTIEAECGRIKTCAIDLSCVEEESDDDDDCCSKKKKCCKKQKKRCITINLNTCKPCRKRCDCDEEADNQVSPCENKRIVLTYCCKDACDCDKDDCTFVTIYLTNDGCPVTSDFHGNCLPTYYKIGRGQLKWLEVVNGRISKIVN